MTVLVKSLADGQLASSTGDLYTAPTATQTVVESIKLVNTDTSARTVNLYLLPNGGTARRIVSKDLSLAAGYSVEALDKPVTLSAGDKIQGAASAASVVDYVISGVDTSGGVASSSFTGHADTPDSYDGQAGYYAKVNAAETALEFVDTPPGIVEDDAYGAGWDADTSHAPSQNAVYDTLAAHYADVDAHGEVVTTCDTNSATSDDLAQSIVGGAGIDTSGATSVVTVAQEATSDPVQILTTRGDVMFRNATVPARLAKGTEGQVLTMGADDPAWSAAGAGLASKVKAETRDMTAASGNVAYTGYGFQPTALLILIELNAASPISIGFSDSAKALGAFVFPYYGLWEALAGRIISLDTASGAYQIVFTLVSYDADGFTLTWTKLGNPTGTANLLVWALR